MSIDELLPLSGVRGHDTSVSLVYSIYSSLDNLKVHQAQCRDLGRKCGQLLLSLADYTRNMSADERILVTDEVEYIITRVHDRIRTWSGYSRTRAFIRQTEIGEGVQAAYDELVGFASRSSMLPSLEPSTVDGRAVLETEDGVLIRDIMADVLHNVGELKLLLSTYPPEETEGVMQVIQDELKDTNLGASEVELLRNGLWELHEMTDRLPPSSDLTGQVSKTSQTCTLASGSNDIFRGQWLGRQEVSLWIPRKQTPVAQMLFQEQVSRWRNLDHKNILKLYGTAFVDGALCSVSSWFEGVMAPTYVQERTATEKIRILADVASGMAYLHLNDVTHGDLRGDNVIISSAGEVRISSYGLNEFFEEPNPSLVRWQAPEIIKPTNSVPAMPPTDVWSFAMLCVELLSGRPPYSEYPKDTSVAVVVVAGTLPKRPSLRTTPTLTTRLWSLFERCWNYEPAKRPLMSEVAQILCDFSPSSDRIPGGNETPVTASSSGGSHETSTPSTFASSASGSDASSLRRFPSVLSQFSARRSSSVSSISKAPSTSSCDVPPLPSSSSHAPIQQTATPQESFERPRSRGKKSDGGKGLFRIASISRLRSKHRVHGVSDDPTQLPPPPPPPLLTQPSESGKGPERNVPSGPNLRPSSVAGLYSTQRSGTSVTSLGSIDEKPSRWVAASTLSQSLATALADPEPVLRTAADGRVEAGTLEGLVRRLFEDSGYTSEDVSYRYIFLACYGIFASSMQLFGRLRAHYEDVEDGNHDGCGDACATRRYSILLLLKTWLQLDYEDMNETILNSILAFARSVQGSQTVLTLSREIATLVEHKLVYIEPSLSPGLSVYTHPRVTLPRAADIVPLELAVALTVLEGAFFSQLTHFDCLAQLQRLAGARRVERAVGASNRITNWVKKSVLRSESLDVRTDVYKFFLNTAEECTKLANFASMAAIVNALQSSTLRRLVLTRESTLRKHEKNMLSKMVELLDPARNHRAYRAAIRDHKGATVPWLAVHLHDLHAVLVSHPAVLDGTDGRPLINFSRFSALTAAIREVLQYKVPDLRAQKSPNVLAYLEAQLRATPPEANIEAFEARSKQLAESEEKLRAQRLPELRALGFATPDASAQVSHGVQLTRTSTSRTYASGWGDSSLAGF